MNWKMKQNELLSYFELNHKINKDLHYDLMKVFEDIRSAVSIPEHRQTHEVSITIMVKEIKRDESNKQ